MKDMARLSIGDAAPAFTASDQAGKTHSVPRGEWTLLYFYPKDDTPGCTKEACAIRDAYPDFKKLKIAVFGISVDSEKSHAKFVEKYDLPFTLLSDEKKAIVGQYGVRGKKKFMGREYMGTMRASFLISPEGKIAKIYEAVKPEAHAAEVLADMAGFKGK